MRIMRHIANRIKMYKNDIKVTTNNITEVKLSNNKPIEIIE